MHEKVALIGGSGAIGMEIAKKLASTGRPFRVIGRSQSSLQRTFGSFPGAEVAEWNPDDTASIAQALQGIETAVYMVGIPYWQFEKHPEIMRRTLDAAERAGVKRILLIGTDYPYGLPQSMPIREDHPRNPHSFKGQMRKAQEDLLIEAGKTGRFQTAVLRLPDFYGPGVSASFLDGAIQAAANGGVANMIGPIDTPHEFVYVPDVGPVVTKLLDHPDAYGHVWHLAGAGVTSQVELVSELERIAGRKIKRRVVGKSGLRLLGLFQPMMREMVEMHYLQTQPVIMDDSALEALIGPIKKTSYAEGLRRSVDAARKI